MPTLPQSPVSSKTAVDVRQPEVNPPDAPLFAVTRLEEVYASLAWKGAPKSLDDMDLGIFDYAKRVNEKATRRNDPGDE